MDKVRKLGLPADFLKYYAALAMVIDHVAWRFVPLDSIAGQMMHIIGRTVAPIMCFLLTEGFHHSRSVKKYISRMAVFALISWIPYYTYMYNKLPFSFQDGKLNIARSFFTTHSMLFTLTLCLIILTVKHSKRILLPFKVAIILALLYISEYGDWLYFAPIWVLLFDSFRGNFKYQAVAFTVSSVILWTVTGFFTGASQMFFQYAVILALIPIYFYNGKRNVSGKTPSAFNKWFFYIFYPAHLVIITIIHNFI